MLCNAVVVVVVAVRLSMYLSTYLPICKLENEATLQDFLNVLTWRHRKRSKSARFPQYFTLTTSATKQFCDTSSSFEVDNIKNYEILRDFLQKWKVACGADGLVPMRFAIFPFHLSKVLCPARKVASPDPAKCCTCHATNLKIWRSTMQPFSGNLRPDLPTSLINMSLLLRLPREMHLYRSSSDVPRRPVFLNCNKKPWRFAHFWQGTESLALATQKRHLNLQKWSDHVVFFNIFWLGNLLRSSTACTFSTSQLPKVLRTWCAFAHFDFVNVLHATTECTFSTSQLPKVLRCWGAFSILTWKCTTACTFWTSQLSKILLP